MTDMAPVQAPEGAIPPLRNATREIWNDTRSAISALYDSFLIAMTINVVGDLVTYFFVRGWPEESTGTLVVAALVGVAQAYFITPYVISIHRYIVLGEVAPSYLTHFGGPRFMRFFKWTLGLALLFTLPVLIVNTLPLGEGARAFLMLAVSVAAIIFGLRLSIMFPSIAVDAPGATYARVMADTRGHAWRIFLLGLLVILPFLAIVVAIAIIFAVAGAADRETVLSTVIGSIVESFLLTMVIVMASRLFGWLGIQVKQE